MTALTHLRRAHSAIPMTVSTSTGSTGSTSTAPNSTAAGSEEEQRFSLSVTQVLASMSAAVTAALIGSRLGVAGTLIGAALASVVTVVGSAVVGHSLVMTRRQVQKAVLQVRRGDEGTTSGPAADEAGTILLPAVLPPAADQTVVIPRAVLPSAAARRPGPEHAEPGRPRPTRRRVSAGVLVGLAATAAIFVSSLGAVTLLETIKGSPLSGGTSGGLSVLGGSGGPAGGSITVPATTTEQVTELSTVTASEATVPATTSASKSATPTTALGSSPAAPASPAGSVVSAAAAAAGAADRSAGAMPTSGAPSATGAPGQ